MCSGVGWACSALYVISAALCGGEVFNMADHGRYGSPRFEQLDDDYKVWAAYQRAQLKKEKLRAAVVTDRRASSSDDKKSEPVVNAWDTMNEAALATIQMSVKPVHLNTVTSVDTAKEALDALKVMFEARDNGQLLRLMDELSSLKKGGDENIIKFASRAKMLRDELAMLGNPVDDNTLALRVLAGLSAEYGMLRTVLENKDTKLVMSDVTGKLLQVEQRHTSVGASKPSGSVKSQAFAAAAPNKPFDKKSVVCFYCKKKGHMQRDCHKKKADEAKGKGKHGGGGREGGHGGGPHAGAALAYSASNGNNGSSKARGSSLCSSTWVLDSGATNHMAAGDKGFSVRTAGSGAEVTLANGEKVPIKGHGHVSMDVGNGKTKTRMVLGEAMLVPDLTSNLLSVRAVDRNPGAVVFVGNACYILSRGCHGYITEEYIHALYPYPLRIRAGDAYSKCIMRKRGEDISIVSDKNCKIMSDPCSRYERRDTGIYKINKLLGPTEFRYNAVHLSFPNPTIGRFMCNHVAATSGNPVRPGRNRSNT